MATTRSIGMVLLGIWLVLTGLLPFLKLNVPYLSAFMSVIAILAGVLILARR